MLAKGQILNSRYRIIRHIKSGGMGAVYEAFDMTLKARVVIKENLRAKRGLAFQREAQLLANLRHTSLPYCSNFFSVKKKKYLVMEFIEGDDLATLMTKSRAPLKAELVTGWAKQLLEVLDYLHGEAILHRDIKPSNIKVIDGRVYLLDLGLAYGQSGDMDTIRKDEFDWGSYSRYSSLEQLRCERTSPASDLYSLAATLYELLTAVRPAVATDRFQMLSGGKNDPLKDMRSYSPGLDKDVNRAIMLGLSMDPHKRPQSARQMRQIMFPEKPPQPKHIVTRERSRRKAFIGISLLCALLGLLIHALANREPRRAETAPAPASPVASNVPADQLADEAEQLMRRGKYVEARLKITEALSLYPDSAYVHFIYGDLLWDTLDEIAEAAANMPEVQEQADFILRLAQPPKSEKEFLARSWAHLVKGDLSSALADAHEAVRLNPASGQGLMLRGTIRYQQATLISKDSLKSAAGEILADYNRAIEKMREYPQVYINRAQIHAKLGDFNLAIGDIERAVGLQPGRASFYVELGDVYYLRGNFQEARKSYRTAIRKNPGCYKAYLGLADIFYFHAANWKGAAAMYRAANGIHKTGYAFGQIGWAYNSLGQFEEAKKNFSAALRYNQNDFISWQGLANSFVGVKDFKSALDSYDNALTNAPKNDLNFQAGLHHERAKVYRQLGQEGLAEEDEQWAEKLGE